MCRGRHAFDQTGRHIPNSPTYRVLANVYRVVLPNAQTIIAQATAFYLAIREAGSYLSPPRIPGRVQTLKRCEVRPELFDGRSIAMSNRLSIAEAQRGRTLVFPIAFETIQTILKRRDPLAERSLLFE